MSDEAPYNEEEKLLAQLRERDRKAFEQVFQLYYKRLFLFGLNYVANHDVAEDLVQDVFLKLWSRLNREGLPEGISLKAWLFTSLKNVCIDHLRHLQVVDKNNSLLAESLVFAQAIDIEVDETVTKKLQAAVNTLPEQARHVLELKVIEGLKYHEVAARLNISVNTVKTQLSRAYKKIRESFS